MRSRLAIPLLLTFLLLPIAATGTATTAPQYVRAVKDLTGFEDQTTLLAPNVPIPAATSGLGPGTHLLINMQGSTYGCTANFVWTDGSNYYLGAAGHCFLPETKTATHGPGADWSPSGTVVRACVSGCSFGGETGFIITGTLVTLGNPTYARQTQNGADVGNDFGIVKIPPQYHNHIRPSMPVWTGPTVGSGAVTLGAPICHYGNGVVFGEVWPTMARMGVGISEGGTVGPNGRRWNADLASAFGDSGSAIVTCKVDANGGVYGVAAAGVLTHLTVGVAITGGTTIPQAKNMVSTQAGITINVVT